MFSEDELLPLAALADVVFCPRRAVLHRVDQIWADSRHTVIGEYLHEKVHAGGVAESRGNLIVARGLRLRSMQLGVVGIADVVEFHVSDNPEVGMCLPGRQAKWVPFPIEYKKGVLREQMCFKVQLCAQAVCLEEMLQTSVCKGALFYGASRRRLDVVFDQSLRVQTIAAAKKLHTLIKEGVLPTGTYDAKCKECSLFTQCMPKITGGKSATAWLAKQLET